MALTQTQDTSLAASQYLALGFSVIPIGYPPADAKRPAFDAVDSWVTYQKRLPEPAELERWFDGMDERNIGIIAGSVSRGLVIIDCDDLATYAALVYRYPELRASLTVRTGKGRHIYTYAPEPVRTSKFELNGLTHHIKAEGSYCVAPPSLHASGRRYEWVDVDADPAILDLGRLRAALRAIGAKDAGVRAVPEGQAPAENWVARSLADGARHGERDELTFKLACYFASKQIPFDITEQILVSFASHCEQPWGEYDVRAKVRSAYNMQERNE